MLQQPNPKDFILASGTAHTVREFIEYAFEHVGLNWKEFYRHDPRFQRPIEPQNLLGDPTKAHEELGWKTKTSLRELAAMMVESDLDRLKQRV